MVNFESVLSFDRDVRLPATDQRHQLSVACRDISERVSQHNPHVRFQLSTTIYTRGEECPQNL